MLVMVTQFSSSILAQNYNYFGFPSMINIEKCLFDPAKNVLLLKHISIN